MEFLSDSVLPWLCSFVGWLGSFVRWLSESLRTEVAAAWAQAILSVAAVAVAIRIAKEQSKQAHEQAERQHQENYELFKRQIQHDQQERIRRQEELVRSCWESFMQIASQLSATTKAVTKSITVDGEAGALKMEPFFRQVSQFHSDLLLALPLNDAGDARLIKECSLLNYRHSVILGNLERLVGLIRDPNVMYDFRAKSIHVAIESIETIVSSLDQTVDEIRRMVAGISPGSAASN